MNSLNRDEEDDITMYANMIQDNDQFINIVIEGKDDKLIYDEFEEIYGLSQPLVSVFPVGGRNTVLGIFDKLKVTPHIKKAIFIVDQDQWVLTGIDPQYNHPHIIYTHGYSFENDVFIDGDLENDMQKKNRDILENKLPTLLKWYALEVSRIQNGYIPKKLSVELGHLFNCIQEFTTPEPDETFPSDIFNRLINEYPRLLRGKTLLKFYISIMNEREHCNNHTYSIVATIENVCKYKGIHLNRIFSEVDQLYKNLTA